jgi:hypothetical protein
MQNIENIISTVVVFAAFVIVIIAALNFILKMRIIKSGNQDEVYIKALSTSIEYKESSLKWGIMLLFGGIGLIIVSQLQIPDMPESPLTYGILAISLAAGFFVYYLIAVRKKDLR